MGKPSRDKGARRERELVALFRSWGLEAYRVPLSGATEHSKGDVDCYKIGRDAPFCGESKAKKGGFKQLYSWLEKDGADYLALRKDNAEWIFVLPERVMRELLQQ